MNRDRLIVASAALGALAVSWLCGVRFISGDLYTSWPLLDVELLRHDLLRSLFYLHAQPPLLNLLVGLALKLGHAAALLTMLWSACAVATALFTHALAADLGAARPAAVASGVLCGIAPSTLLYAHHVGPELATAAALSASALFVSRARFGWAFVLLGVAALLRPLIAPPVVLLALLAAGRRAWKPALAVLVVLLALCAKNAAISGVFATSSWAGMNFARVTVGRVAPDKRPPLPPPFAATAARPGTSGIPALDQVRRSGGEANYNNLAYAQLSRAYLREDLRALLAEPLAVARAWALAWLLFFRPADDWKFVQPNRTRIAAWADLWDDVWCLRLPLPGMLLGLTDVYLTLLLGVPIVLARSARDRRTWYALALILGVALIGNCFEVGENYRFRLLIAPLCLALGAAARRRKMAT